MVRFRLREGLEDIPAWAARYPADYDQVIAEMVPVVQKAGHLTLEQLKAVCRWKSPMSAHHCLKNSPEYVAEVTRIMLTTETSERLRFELPGLLWGVGPPTTSVLLHWFHEERYPILDFRALWSLSAEVPDWYSFEFWWEYVQACRALADEHGVDMRTLDRALWQFSKERQRR